MDTRRRDDATARTFCSSRVWVAALGVLAVGQTRCASGRCYSNADCTPPKVCFSEQGRCQYECSEDQDCERPLVCVEHRCASRRTAARKGAAAAAIDCPDDMVRIENSFCMDRYEASRPDATGTDAGTDDSSATSQPGVLPWKVGDDNAQARAACRAAGKDLCTEEQWALACHGPDGTDYGYGDRYEPETCNGIDLFGPGRHQLLPCGILSDCRSGYGVYDLNGNLWEHVLGGSGATVRGGAYDCSDSQQLHRCDYVPLIWTPLSLGFRCCLVPEASADLLLPKIVA
jgi:hypothetical protein